jgi:hypothetical protein
MTASNLPNIVHLTYEFEGGSWFAESEQMPSLFAGGDSLDDAKGLARQAVRDEFGKTVSVFDWVPVPGELEPVVASRGSGPSLQPSTAGAYEAPAFVWTPEPTAA